MNMNMEAIAELVMEIRFQDKWRSGRGFSHQEAHESNATLVICPSRRADGVASVAACLTATEMKKKKEPQSSYSYD